MEPLWSLFGASGAARQSQGELLRRVVRAAGEYETIKRVLVWGSFVSGKAEPDDLDYSLVVSVDHKSAVIMPEHRRFLVPVDAARFYGVDRSELVLPDYPFERYIEALDFFCRDRKKREHGIIEIHLHGESLS